MAVPSEGCAPRGQVVQAQVAVMGVPPVSAEVEAQVEAQADTWADLQSQKPSWRREAVLL